MVSRKVSSAAQALWMTSPTCPPKPRRRRKGGNLSSRMKQSSLAGMSTAKPHGMPESGVGTRRVASAPPGPPKSIIRRASAMDDKPDLSSEASAKEEGRQLVKQNETVLTRRHEYGEAARNAGERGPRKVPEAFAQQKSRGPWPKGGNFSGKGDRNPPKPKTPCRLRSI